MEAYSPVAHGAALNNPALAALAGRYSVSIPQLCIRYCLRLGLLPLPKTANPEHLRSNATVDFVVSNADMATLRNAEPMTDYGEASTFPVFGREAAGQRRERVARRSADPCPPNEEIRTMSILIASPAKPPS